MAVLPLLFLDVDGPLNPTDAKATQRPAGYTTHRMLPPSWITAEQERRWRPAHRVNPLRVWLNLEHGPALLALPYQLVWATTWNQEANDWISPILGLPTNLPVAAVPNINSTDERGVHSKTRHLVAHAAASAASAASIDASVRPR